MSRSTDGALHPTADTFEAEVMRSEVPVLVDFWAPWCPPCMMLKPEMQKLAVELAGRARVAFVNVDEEPELAEAFGVRSIPTIVTIKGGRLVDTMIGLAPRASILARLGKHLGV